MEEGVGQREEEQCLLGKREKSCAVRCTRLHVPVEIRSSTSIRTVHPPLGSRAGERGECRCGVVQIPQGGGSDAGRPSSSTPEVCEDAQLHGTGTMAGSEAGGRDS